MKTTMIFVILSAALHGDTLTTSAFGAIETFDPNPDFLASCSLTGNASALCSDSNDTASVQVSARADYGSLTGDISAALLRDTPSTLYNLQSNASFADELTIDTPAGLARTGFVQFTFGESARDFSSDAGVRVTVLQNGNIIGSSTPYCPPCAPSGIPIDLTFSTSLAPFTSGVPFIFGTQSALDTFLEPFCTSCRKNVSDTLSVNLIGISVFDNSGGIIQGASISSFNSTYGGLVSQVPETSSVLLLATILATVLLARRGVQI